jgi:hypothetical protein
MPASRLLQPPALLQLSPAVFMRATKAVVVEIIPLREIELRADR